MQLDLLGKRWRQRAVGGGPNQALLLPRLKLPHGPEDPGTRVSHQYHAPREDKTSSSRLPATCADSHLRSPQDPVLSQPPVALIVPWSSPPPQPLSLLQARYHTRRQSTLAATEAGAAPLLETQPSQAPGIPRDEPSSGERPEQSMVSGQTCAEG